MATTEVLKVFGFSKKERLDEMSPDELQLVKSRQNRKYGITAVVFPEVNRGDNEVIIESNDGNIVFRDGNVLLADGNLV